MIDQPERYIDGRWASAHESDYRSRGFKLHDQYPVTYRLPIHLEG